MNVEEHFEDKGYTMMWLWPIMVPLGLILMLGLGIFYTYLWLGGFVYDRVETLIDKFNR